jgi:hypothetical protein
MILKGNFFHFGVVVCFRKGTLCYSDLQELGLSSFRGVKETKNAV